MKAKEYKSGVKPIWCPGCGHFGVFNAITKALAAVDAKPEDYALISGIGCSSRLPAYATTYGFHGVHGRALPVATGLKVARPEIHVIAVGGDGDGFSIGGNHFLHACRRNVDMVYIVMDNQVYGMTKGQASPTTPADWRDSKLTPRGPEIPPLQPLAMALAAGAGFIARGYGGDPNGLAAMIHEAMAFRGFAFIQVLSQCITFVPEQQAWKELITEFNETTDDPARAGAILHGDNGLRKGVFYRNPRPSWPVSHGPVAEPGSGAREGFLAL
ncbi:MAG: 2-oxoglutarate synthase [Porticoccaceae bacterium]|nr:2-oxoglutarate synthase [Porticoccaceae bacterium]